MLITKYGPFNGDSWEGLCQLIFKQKYGEQNYQEMPASPGDFGIEGFIKNTGTAFQCYCPDFDYTQNELYEKQRDKITKDLGKLKTFEKQIAQRIGELKISEWVFLSPKINRNSLLEHAKKKENQVRTWKLDILHENFSVILKDADFYAKEINQIRFINGEKLIFQDSIPEIESVTGDITDYENNIHRKNIKRCMSNGVLNSDKHSKINEFTLRKWIEGEGFLKKIESEASEVYFQLVRVINQYEDEVGEISLTWEGSPQSLVDKIKDSLNVRIKEAVPSLGDAERYKIADHMTSKWIALCPLEIEE